MQIDKGIALNDIIAKVYGVISSLELPKQTRIYLIRNMADIEHHLTLGTSDKMQLSALVGAFKIAVDMADTSLDR